MRLLIGARPAIITFCLSLAVLETDGKKESSALFAPFLFSLFLPFKLILVEKDFSLGSSSPLGFELYFISLFRLAM